MDLVIERTARWIEKRYKLNRKYSISRDYSAPRAVQMLDSMLPGKFGPMASEFTIRHLEQDPKTEARMDHKTTQFFLRNLPKVSREHEESNEMPFQEEENISPDFVDYRHVAFQRPRFIAQWTTNDFKWLQSIISKTLLDEDWTDRFSREIRDTLMKGLWTSNPDPLDVHRPDFWEKD